MFISWSSLNHLTDGFGLPPPILTVNLACSFSHTVELSNLPDTLGGSLKKT